MPHINRRRTNTKSQIIHLAAHLFIDEGYHRTSCSKIAKTLDISPGNITFYFKTKEELLAVLVDKLFSFQNLIMEQAANEGKTALLAYCLELTAIAAICEEDAVAKDFYTSIYTSDLTLARIRHNDTEKTKAVFGAFQPDWSEEQWQMTENIVSGIEYAAIMTKESEIPLARQLEQSLDAIMLLYGVPREIRKVKIEKVLSMDYRSLGRRILTEFKEYIQTVDEEDL